ncbi:carboxymuconolactone decarboxylase family protein [Chloroflexota bacterium]
MTEELTKRQAQVKEKFLRERKWWNTLFDPMLRADPDFLEAYVNFITVPLKKGVLEPKVIEFIAIAIDAATTHLHEAGTRLHIRNALKLGATKGELVAVLELLPILGIHSVSMGFPILEEELKEDTSKELTKRQAQVKEMFLRERKWWDKSYDPFLRTDPDFLEAFVNFVTVPLKKGVLEPKVIEFIYIAIDAATTHLHEYGTRLHIRNALKLGATKEELVEVLELLPGLGIHSVLMGLPILEEELESFAQSTRT